MEFLVATGLVKKAKCQNPASQYSSVSKNEYVLDMMAFFRSNLALIFDLEKVSASHRYLKYDKGMEKIEHWKVLWEVQSNAFLL